MTVVDQQDIVRLVSRPLSVRPPLLPRERGRQKLLDRVPLLHGEEFDPDLASCAELLEELLTVAAGCPATRAESRAVMQALASGRLDSGQALTEALAGHFDHLASLAAWSGAPSGLLSRLADLAVRPSLAALEQALAGLYRESGLRGGCCPICGSWPGLLEERAGGDRRLRCNRCAGEWEAQSLRCGLCGEPSGLELLRPAPSSGRSVALEGCRHCRGYLRVSSIESPADLAGLIWTELASEPLDRFARERGYRSPEAPCFRLEPGEPEPDELMEDLLEAD